ncbi:TetR/AcrR family transcriptional regulator [Phenylobacterium sp.]|jgi:AcrR family transcriptional regulator|uniref:TetR/AcrR family transcriptional regulator n=1 Tax=Phenylobacterium sp. TaxID=1871053 RepID=UPI002F42FA42
MPKISVARKDERRRQILVAAMKCFGRSGFQDATIQDICAEAGLSPGAVYSYFENKDAIVQATAELGERLAARRESAVQEEREPIEQLRAFFREFGRSDAAHGNQYDLRIWAEAIGNREVRSIYLRQRGEVVASLARLLEPAAQACRLDPAVLADLTTAVIAGCEVRKAIEPSSDVAPVLEALLQLISGPSLKADPDVA